MLGKSSSEQFLAQTPHISSALRAKSASSSGRTAECFRAIGTAESEWVRADGMPAMLTEEELLKLECYEEEVTESLAKAEFDAMCDSQYHDMNADAFDFPDDLEDLHALQSTVTGDSSMTPEEFLGDAMFAPTPDEATGADFNIDIAPDDDETPADIYTENDTAQPNNFTRQLGALVDRALVTCACGRRFRGSGKGKGKTGSSLRLDRPDSDTEREPSPDLDDII